MEQLLIQSIWDINRSKIITIMNTKSIIKGKHKNGNV